jgi:hypothetical protein
MSPSHVPSNRRQTQRKLRVCLRSFVKKFLLMSMVYFHFGRTLSAGGAEPLPSLRSVQGLDFPAFPAGVATLRSNYLSSLISMIN